MDFYTQTKVAVKDMPLLFKAGFYIWSTVPIWYLAPGFKNYTLLDTIYAFLFTLIWITFSLSISLISAFQTRNKKALKTYAEVSATRKITGQNFMAAVQSKKGYERLNAVLPPQFTNDLGLYVAARWGRINNIMVMALFGLIVLGMVLNPVPE